MLRDTEAAGAALPAGACQRAPAMKGASPFSSPSESPAKIILLTTVMVFGVELLIMLLLERIGGLPESVRAYLDALLLSLALLIILYFSVFRPMAEIIEKKDRAEAELRRHSDHLEELVEERSGEVRDACERALRLEAQQIEFCVRTIRIATRGKLEVIDEEKILDPGGTVLAQWRIEKAEDIAATRRAALEIAQSLGAGKEQLDCLAVCIGEAVSNAFKHAGSGSASLSSRLGGGLRFMVKDDGPGIPALNLPDVAFTNGYSTAGTGGLGYKMLINCADKVYLATGPRGTRIAFDMALQAPAAAKAPTGEGGAE